MVQCKPAESQRGPRGRPLSGPLHIPSPYPSFPLPPLRSGPLKSGGPGVSPPGNFFLNLDRCRWDLVYFGELMMTYNKAILGTESLKNGVIVTVILLKALSLSGWW